VTVCTLMCKASRSSRISASRMCLLKSFNNRRTHLERKIVKTHTLALIEGPQSADSGPEVVGSLGHEHQGPFFHLDHMLASGLRANLVQESARFSHPRHVHRGLLRRSPGAMTLLN
jgi:hypothetical protein